MASLIAQEYACNPSAFYAALRQKTNLTLTIFGEDPNTRLPGYAHVPVYIYGTTDLVHRVYLGWTTNSSMTISNINRARDGFYGVMWSPTNLNAITPH